MAKSDRSSQNSQPPHHVNPGADSPAQESSSDDDGSVSPPECQESTSSDVGPGAVESRAERLRRIRQDVRDGRYDSDEMLEKALEIMLKRMSGDTE